jgi:chitin disaccharide deacetylase
MATPEFAAGSPSPASRSSARRIVLHADDLGMSEAVSSGILQGFERGLLTSTSLLSNAPDAARVLEDWQDLESRRAGGNLASRPRRQRLHDPEQPFDLGIHLNLTQGRPLIGGRYPAELLDANGCFPGIFGLFRRLRRTNAAVTAALEEELTCQVQFMLDRGHQPTHLNGHQYIELLPAVSGIARSLLQRFRIPAVRVAWEPTWLKSFTWPGIRTTPWLIGGLKKFYANRFRKIMLRSDVTFADAFFGTMTAGTTTLETLRAFLAASQNFRLAEIGLHPGGRAGKELPKEKAWRDPLADLRPREAAMVASVDLENLLAAGGYHLGRLGRAERL